MQRIHSSNLKCLEEESQNPFLVNPESFTNDFARHKRLSDLLTYYLIFLPFFSKA
jgi:hypothetical protein